jgi:hypothetical protein
MADSQETQLDGGSRSPRSPLRLLTLLVVMTACTTPRGADQIRRDSLNDVTQLKFQSAAERLNGLYNCRLVGEADKPGGGAEKADFNDKHGLIWRMQRGMLDHMAADFAASQQHFHDAAALVDTHRSKLLGRVLLSAATNETVKPYDGMGFEHIQVDYYRALNAVLQAQEAEGLYRSPAITRIPSPAQAPVPEEVSAFDPPAEEVAEPEAAAIEPEVAPEPVKPGPLYDQAISFARRMVLDQLKVTYDTADAEWMTTYRFADDPFARVMLAAMIYASPERTDGDLQVANVMMHSARQAYRDHKKIFADDKHFRYEVQTPVDLLDRLQARFTQLYDPGAWEEELRGLDPGIAAKRRALQLREGQGSILVLNHVGLITRPETLDLRFRSGVGILAGIFSLREEERQRGITIHQVTIGPFQVAAKGPGSEIIDDWTGIIFAPEIMRHTDVLSTVMGMALPVHRQDEPIPPRASVTVDGSRVVDLGVASDLDAYARATLKDGQVRLFLKSLTRVIAKQVAVAASAEEVEKKNGAGWGWLTRLVGSTAMTMTEVADVRAWFLLPDHIEATLIDVPAGAHELRLNSPIGEVDLGSVTVPAGRLVIVPTRTLPPKRFY